MDQSPAAVDQHTASRTIHALRGAAAGAERAIARALEPFGITGAQFAVLDVMRQAAQQSMGCSELGRRLAGSSPDVTRLLDRLESGGFVSRERDGNDRRVVYTRISEKGLELMAAAAPAVREAEEQLLADLLSGDRERLAELLDQLQPRQPGN